MSIELILLFVGSGLAGGFLSGLLGIGGGIIFVALLTEVFTIKGISSIEIVRFTLANSLSIIFFSSLIASIQQIRTKNFNFTWVGITTFFGTISSILLTFSVLHGTWYKASYFNIIYLLVLIFSLYNIWESVLLRKDKILMTESFDKAPTFKLAISGIITSLISSFTGLGGGVVFVTLVHKWIKIPMKTATSLAHGALTLPTLAIGLIFMFNSEPSKVFYNTQIGFLVPEIVLPTIVGVFFSAPLGVKVSQKMKEKIIKVIFTILIFIIALKTIYKML